MKYLFRKGNVSTIVSTEAPGPFGEGGAGPSIAIIGAGVGGLTLSALLPERGASARIFQRAEAFARVGAGSQAGPNAMKVLTRLGLHHDLAKVAYSPAMRAPW